MMRRHGTLRATGVGVAALACAVVGCSGRPSNVALVSGRVTLNGKPLPSALVTFDPVVPGCPSYTRTAADGTYTLGYTPTIQGAEIGEHTVRVKTGSPGDPDAKPPLK